MSNIPPNNSPPDNDKPIKLILQSDRKEPDKSGVADIAMVLLLLLSIVLFFSAPRERTTLQMSIGFDNGNWQAGFVYPKEEKEKKIGSAEFLENGNVYRMQSEDPERALAILQPGNKLFEQGICLSVLARSVKSSPVYGVSFELQAGDSLHVVIDENQQSAYYECGQRDSSMKSHGEKVIADALKQTTPEDWHRIQIAITPSRLDGWLNERQTWELVGSERIKQIINQDSLSIANFGLFVRSGTAEFREFHAAGYSPDCHP